MFAESGIRKENRQQVSSGFSPDVVNVLADTDQKEGLITQTQARDQE